MNLDTGQAQQPTVAASPFTTAIYAGPLGNVTTHPFYQSLGNVSIAVRSARGLGSQGADHVENILHAHDRRLSTHSLDGLSGPLFWLCQGPSTLGCLRRRPGMGGRACGNRRIAGLA